MSSPAVRRLWSTGVSVVLVVVIIFLQRFVVAEKDELAPIATSGTADAAVATDDFTAEVVETGVSTTLETVGADGATEQVEANGVWAVVWVRVTAEHTTVDTMHAELRMDDGTLYSERGWFTDSLDRADFSPGITVFGAFVFEVPQDRLDQPSLLLTNATGLDRRLGAQADIDLGLTDPAPSDEPIALLPPEVQMGDSADASE
ncbi:hypothetical protein DFP74_2109 [Nocardiopsis sp. Huas11]|uniref:hypothetical protein n=1 Tax=Nocardiopsis sp. Huas11 TaxID=2183912 RepID=UPI000EB5A5F3|nr:hypothetical protein [Nocardiopsis sp. Huas11]RKS06477.1 hypothetical protein DFP74_2109 [Nocardiopsis sp. Huas11]